MSIDQWVARCRDRFEVARIAMTRIDKSFVGAEIDVDVTPHNPSVRMSVQSELGGFFAAGITHGDPPCLDFEPVPIPAWTSQSGTTRGMSRIRRVNGDEALIDAHEMPAIAAEHFRREMERAIDACFVDAKISPLAKVPSGINCGDTVDKCPDNPTEDDEGCPTPVK